MNTPLGVALLEFVRMESAATKERVAWLEAQLFEMQTASR
jgi:hypothetical protein